MPWPNLVTVRTIVRGLTLTNDNTKATRRSSPTSSGTGARSCWCARRQFGDAGLPQHRTTRHRTRAATWARTSTGRGCRCGLLAAIDETYDSRVTFRLALIAAARCCSRLAERFGDDRPLDSVGRLDVERGLGALDPDDARLSAALSQSNIDELVDRGHAARSSLYRRVKNIRLALLAAGLKAA